MWIFYSIGSSFFTGITAVLAKCGIKKTDSDVFLREGITGTKIVSVLLIGIEGICLLYTSPSPRDGLLSRMPSSA